MDLIYCADGNERFASLAIDAGFRYGARLPATVYFPPWFADQDWRDPDRRAYMDALREHEPVMATVLDWERPDQLVEVLDWAEEAAQYVKRVLIVPKVIGGIPRIPDRVGGKPVVLAYSVPTRYAGSEVPLWEFAGRPVHLLGGSPHRQMEIWHYLTPIASVVSVDGNMANKMATRWTGVWVPGTSRGASNRWWPTLQELTGGWWGDDATYEAFRRSCENIMATWERLVRVNE